MRHFGKLITPLEIMDDCFLGAMARNNPISLGECKGANILRNDELKSGFEKIRKACVFLP